MSGLQPNFPPIGSHRAEHPSPVNNKTSDKPIDLSAGKVAQNTLNPQEPLGQTNRDLSQRVSEARGKVITKIKNFFKSVFLKPNTNTNTKNQDVNASGWIKSLNARRQADLDKAKLEDQKKAREEDKGKLDEMKEKLELNEQEFSEFKKGLEGMQDLLFKYDISNIKEFPQFESVITALENKANNKTEDQKKLSYMENIKDYLTFVKLDKELIAKNEEKINDKTYRGDKGHLQGQIGEYKKNIDENGRLIKYFGIKLGLKMFGEEKTFTRNTNSLPT